VGFGTELLFVIVLGLVVLGPKRLHTMLGQVTRAKAEFDKASRSIKSHLAAELEGAPQAHKDNEAVASGTEPNQPDSLAAPTN
jgi:Sec-independent protein translocase protein TatA